MEQETWNRNLHICSRLGFGVRYDQWKHIGKWSTDKWRKKFFESAADDYKPIRLLDSSIVAKDADGKPVPAKELDADARKDLQQKNTRTIQDLSLSWQKRMVDEAFPLREKLALFWHGHFACRTNNAYFNQQLLDVIMAHALGDFSDLLFAVSRSAAMLQFLNNQQNRKQHANENFAREVMELFTLGRGNYTETDVKEGARAFTGWSYKNEGLFQVNEKQHDEGMKTFLGHSGNLNGDDVLHIILQQPATGKFICTKLYRYFVNDTVNDDHVADLVTVFRAKNGNILEVMKTMAGASWFYHTENMGNLIKSPVAMMVSVQRAIPVTIQNPEVCILFEKGLGQWLFYPPNVSGWAGGNYWIDSSTLMLRLRIPQLMEAGHEFVLQTKRDDDVDMGRATKQKGSQVKAVIDWHKLEKGLDLDGDTFRNRLADYLLGVNATSQGAVYVIRQATAAKADMAHTAIQLMSVPEFQLS